MKLLYIAFKNFSNLHFGANAKVLSQCRAFATYGYEVELIARDNDDIISITPEGKVTKVKPLLHGALSGKLRNFADKKEQMNVICDYVKGKQYDACYIRYDFSDASFVKMLKTLRGVCGKIALELPTYPYEQENSQGIANKVKMAVDKHYREKIHIYVDFIVTFYDGHPSLFDIPVLVVPNGFDFSSMKLVSKVLPNDGIHIIAVSSMREWHGYERMIEGLHEYYKNGDNACENIVLHLVGNGREYGKYKQLAEQYDLLGTHVVMEGAMHGEALDALYEKCALGVDSLARHRSGISVLSSLKSREYGAKGIPIINSCKIDIIEDDFDYILRVPADETPIDMRKVCEFYHKCYDNANREKTGIAIRDYIESKSDMKATLSNVVKRFSNAN